MSLLTVVHGYGTLASRPAAGNAGRIYYATDTAKLYRDNGATWDALSLNALNTASAQLGANHTIGGGSFENIVSVSLAAGTWICWAHAVVIHGSTSDATIQIYDGTTVQAANSMSNEATFASALACVSPPIVLSSTTTVWLRVANVPGGVVHAVAQNSSSGNNATTLTALQVA